MEWKPRFPLRQAASRLLMVALMVEIPQLGLAIGMPRSPTERSRLSLTQTQLAACTRLCASRWCRVRHCVPDPGMWSQPGPLTLSTGPFIRTSLCQLPVRYLAAWRSLARYSLPEVLTASEQLLF